MTKLKSAILGTMEWFWAVCFATAGQFLRPNADLWSSPGKQRVLVIAPHPDDESIGCGGTILKHKQVEDTVWIVFVTDGRSSKAMGLKPEMMAARRKQEAEASAKFLQIDRMIWLGLPENAWDISTLQKELTAILSDFSPQVVYAPSSIDFHPEHLKVALALAISLLNNNIIHLIIRIYQIHVPLTPILANLVANTRDGYKRSTGSLIVYETQWGSLARVFRIHRYEGLFYRIKGPAEVFWQVSAKTYCGLHINPSHPWHQSTFRGIRSRPFTDPLAYLQGLSARRTIRKQVRLQEGK